MITALFTAPLVVSALAEYLTCRLPRRRFWRIIPPAVAAVATLVITLARYYGWSDTGERAPWETLLLFPGVSALAVFLGLGLGWLAYKKLWDPRLMKGDE